MAEHQPADVRRAQILTAALECIGQRGFHATTMDDIVRASGLSKGALYWHFSNKESLFFALFEECEKAILHEWKDIPDAATLDRLYAQGDIVLRHLLEQRALLEAWGEFSNHPTMRDRMAAIYEQSRHLMAKTIRVGIKRGELRKCDPHHLAATLTALIEGLLLQTLVDADYDPLATWPTAWEVVVQGIQRR